MTTRALAALLALAAFGCGGTHRPSVVTSAPRDSGSSGAGRGPTGTATPEPGQALDQGPDVRPVQEDAATSADIVGGDTGEGGPLADIFFEYDSSTLSEEAKGLLQQHAQWLKQHAALKAVVEGHCDERGTVEYNLALGDVRAKAVYDHLVSLGVGAERLSSVSYGKERPLAAGGGEAAWAKNRRVHFVVTR